MKRILFGLLILTTLSTTAQQKITDMPIYSGNVDSFYFPGVDKNVPTNRKVYGVNIGKARMDRLSDSIALVTADGSAKATLATISGLRAKSSVASGSYFQTTDAGQEGLWRWNASSTATDNTGTVIKATGITTGRFERVIQGVVKISWFAPDNTGVSNSTTAIQAAINTGYPIESEHSGKKYLISPLTQSTGRQLLDFTGDTVKLAGSSSSYMLTLSGAGSEVRGGVWDGNKAGTQSTSNSYYDHAAVNINADYCKVRGVTSINSAGIGIKGGAFDYTEISDCIIQGYTVHGIFMQGSGRDCFGTRIERNKVFITAGTGVGIYLLGDADATAFFQRKFFVNWNQVRGPSSGTTSSDICITVRGIDGEVIGNTTLYGDMGISCDITKNSIISLNNIDSTNGSTGYGIEVNGGNNTINGNYIRHTTYGITGSGATRVMDNNNITNNEFIEQTTYGIFFQPSGSNTARNLSITGNTFTRTGTGTWNAIRLTNDCKFSKAHNNTIVGPGVAVSNSRGLFLDKVTSNVAFNYNMISGVERPMSVYNVDATPYTNITFNHNNCAGEAGVSEANFLVVEGSAVFGSYCEQIGTTTSTGKGTDYIDKSANITYRYGTGSPESVVTAATGSIFIRTNGTGTTMMYVKGSGTGNTGWTALSDGDVHNTTAETITGKKIWNATVTGSGGFASVAEITGTPTGGANSDALIGLKITPSFTPGGFPAQ
jgi:hypothetical protein